MGLSNLTSSAFNDDGWLMASGDRYIFKATGEKRATSGSYDIYENSTGSGGSIIYNVNWAAYTIWNKSDYCIMYKNTTKNPKKLKSVTARLISCYANKDFYSVSGTLQSKDACNGASCRYRCTVKIYKNLKKLKDGKLYKDGSKKGIYKSEYVPSSDDWISNKKVNLTSSGSAKSSATFSWNGDDSIHKFDFSSKDIIIPRNGIVVIQLGVDFKNSGEGYIQFDLSGKTSISTETENSGYIWRYDIPDGEDEDDDEAKPRWYLCKLAHEAESNDSWNKLDVTKKKG